MAGLLAARVLSDQFRQVTIIERDALPEIGKHRKGVPQGRHLHGLHPRGREILDELIPGFTATLVGGGAVCGDVLGNLRWQLSGFHLRQEHIGLPALLANRPFIEGHVLAFVRKLPRVSIFEQCSVAGLATSAGGGRITGVRVHGPAGLTDLRADLVVDATGRGSRTPRWLSELGYQPPVEDRVEIGLGYATRNYRLRPGAMNGDHLILTGATPANPRYGVLTAIEGGRHILTLAGIRGDHPPLTVAAMQALTLQQLLVNGAADDPRRYFRTIASVIDVPWDIAVGADLAFPGVPGKRTAKVRLTNAYLPRVHAAATRDARLAGSLVRVIGLKDRPETLLRPGTVLRTLRGSRRACRAGVTAAVDELVEDGQSTQLRTV